MSGQDRTLHRVLEKNLQASGFELSDFMPLPKTGDRIVRIRTVEEFLQELDSRPDEGDSHCYIVRVRPRQIIQSSSPVEETSDSAVPEAKVYHSDGSVNSPYLEHNADVLLAHGEYQLARKIYQTLFQSGHRAAQALYGMAYCFEMEGKRERAIEKYEESVSYQPSLDTFLRLASLLIQMKKDRYASEVLERALGLKDLVDGMKFELHKSAGNAWLRQDRFEEAEKHFQKALQLNPQADDVRANLGSAFLKQNRLLEASRAFQDAVAANPSNDRAQFGLAACLETEGRKKEALEAYLRATEANLSNIPAVFGLMRLSFELRTFGAAERRISIFCESQPVNPEILFGLAGMQFHLGKVDEARMTAQRIQEIRPGHKASAELIARMNQY